MHSCDNLDKVFICGCVISPAVTEAREDQKVLQYIDSCIKKANEASVSRATKIQVHVHVYTTARQEALGVCGQFLIDTVCSTSV